MVPDGDRQRGDSAVSAGPEVLPGQMGDAFRARQHERDMVGIEGRARRGGEAARGGGPPVRREAGPPLWDAENRVTRPDQRFVVGPVGSNNSAMVADCG